MSYEHKQKKPFRLQAGTCLCRSLGTTHTGLRRTHSLRGRSSRLRSKFYRRVWQMEGEILIVGRTERVNAETPSPKLQENRHCDETSKDDTQCQCIVSIQFVY